MNTLKLTSQFKKDLKRYKHKIEVIDKLEVILKLLDRKSTRLNSSHSN